MDIAEIIIKKLNEQLNTVEKQFFTEWYESSSENKELYKRLELIKLKTGKTPDISAIDSSIAFDKVLSNFKSKRKRRSIKTVMKYAAVGLLFIVGGYSIWQFSNSNHNNVIDPHAVTLDMGNGNIISLSDQNQQDIMDEDGNFLGKKTGNEIDYTKAAKRNETAYNCLKVPNGKTFNVRLADGTLVHMNSGSSLKFPTVFSLENFRKVKLTGEAFFEVSKDKKHPFIVNVNQLEITVVGTKFNVSSYPEDVSIKTVLVEGSVKLAERGTKAQFLKPGFEAEWNPKSKKINFSEVDTSIATRWMKKGLVISQLPFDKIITKLERYYGVKIENRNKTINNQVYTAEFEDVSIDQVLSTFQVDTEFNYKIENKKVIIY